MWACAIVFLLVGQITGKVAQQLTAKRKISVLGETMVLNCTINQELIEREEIYWFGPPTSLLVFTSQTRSSCESARRYTSCWNSSSKTCLLSITNVTHNDAGDYKCSYHYQFSNTISIRISMSTDNPQDNITTDGHYVVVDNLGPHNSPNGTNTTKRQFVVVDTLSWYMVMGGGLGAVTLFTSFVIVLLYRQRRLSNKPSMDAGDAESDQQSPVAVDMLTHNPGYVSRGDLSDTSSVENNQHYYDEPDSDDVHEDIESNMPRCRRQNNPPNAAGGQSPVVVDILTHNPMYAPSGNHRIDAYAASDDLTNHDYDEPEFPVQASTMKCYKAGIPVFTDRPDSGDSNPRMNFDNITCIASVDFATLPNEYRTPAGNTSDVQDDDNHKSSSLYKSLTTMEHVYTC